MDPEQAQLLEECIYLTNHLTSSFQCNRNMITACVGERVVLEYRNVMDKMLDTVQCIRKDLIMLQQMD